MSVREEGGEHKMSEKNKIVMEFMKELHDAEDLDYVECVLMSNANSPALKQFLTEAFRTGTASASAGS